MINISHLLLVAAGGMIGSVMRYMTGILVHTIWGITRTIPWGTFFVNITGSFLIGMVIGYNTRNTAFDQRWQLFLTTGICGGFTTFSALSAESFSLLKEQQYALLLLYVSSSLILGIAAAALGYHIIK